MLRVERWEAFVRICGGRLKSHGIWQNGEVERTAQTLARERAFSRPSSSEEERAETLSSFFVHYKWDRPHSGCGGLLPTLRVNGVLATYI
jgi:transposase InsO family protein